jgi:hypothetical protein
MCGSTVSEVRAENDKQLVADVRDEAQDREPRQPRDRAKHQDHEEDRGYVERGDQRRQVEERA